MKSNFKDLTKHDANFDGNQNENKHHRVCFPMKRAMALKKAKLEFVHYLNW